MELFEKDFDEYRKEFRKYKSGQKRDKARNLMEFVTVQEAVYYAYVNAGAYGEADCLLTEIYGDEAKPFLIN